MPRRKPAPAPTKILPPVLVGPDLTAGERAFVAEYVIDDNATRAYKAAYPAASYSTCRSEGCRLTAKPDIADAIQAARDARQERTELRADTALVEAARLAYSDPLYLFEDDGVTPRNLRDIPMDTRRAIASVKVQKARVERAGETTTTYQVIEYKLCPKSPALAQVFAHLGLKQALPPLDVFLAILPANLRVQVVAALAGGEPGG